jgi:polar amino acid transport system substrate-binding protein
MIGERGRRSAAGQAAAAVVMAALALSACGSSGEDGGADTAPAPSGATTVAAPAAVKSAGKLIFCSDIAYPPMEFRKGSTAVGADIDFGNELARRMGVSADFQQTGFDAIVASLLTGKCDAIASGMTITAARRKQMTFVPYIKAGQAVIVPAGNPLGITGLEGLAGRTIAVQVGTTNKDYIEKQVNPKLASAGKPAIKLIAFPQNTDAINALRTQRVDAYFADGPPVAYLVKQQKGQFELAGPQVGPMEFGIAVRKNRDDLATALQQAMTSMYKDGAAVRILEKWGLGDTALGSAS